MKRILIYLFIAAVLIYAGFFIFRNLDRDKGEKNASADLAVVPVEVATVSLYEFQDTTDAVGTLRARETNLLSSKVAGNIDAVLVDIGDRVEAEQVVILLDFTHFRLAVKRSKAAYQAAEAFVAQAESQFEHARKEYRRASRLLSQKVIPQSRFDTAEAAYKAGRDTVDAAKGKFSEARAALETAREHVKESRIRSSISGVVVDRNAEVGQYVTPGVQVLRILDQATVKTDVELSEKDYGKVAVGTAALITVDAFDGQEFSGKVTGVNPMVDPRVRTFIVRIEVPNPSGKLVDGMFARARILKGRRIALAIPRDALNRLPGSGTFYVFVVEENRAVKRTVKIGTVGDQYAEIKEGLTEGERVVISGTGRLRSGTKLKVPVKQPVN